MGTIGICEKRIDKLLDQHESYLESLYWAWVAGEWLTAPQMKALNRYKEEQDEKADLVGDEVEIDLATDVEISSQELQALSKIVNKFKRLGLTDMLRTLTGAYVHSFTTDTTVIENISQGGSSSSASGQVSFNNDTRGYKEIR